MLTFNFLLLTLKLAQAFGTCCGASASNPDALAGREEEEEEAGLCCPPAKCSPGLKGGFSLLWVLLEAKQVWDESDTSFVFTLMPYKTCIAT